MLLSSCRQRVLLPSYASSPRVWESLFIFHLSIQPLFTNEVVSCSSCKRKQRWSPEQRIPLNHLIYKLADSIFVINSGNAPLWKFYPVPLFVTTTTINWRHSGSTFSVLLRILQPFKLVLWCYFKGGHFTWGGKIAFHCTTAATPLSGLKSGICKVGLVPKKNRCRSYMCAPFGFSCKYVWLIHFITRNPG